MHPFKDLLAVSIITLQGGSFPMRSHMSVLIGINGHSFNENVSGSSHAHS